MNSNPVASEVLTLLTVYFTEQCTEYLTVVEDILCTGGTVFRASFKLVQQRAPSYR